MENTIKYQNYKSIINIFDLKGSKVNREVPHSKSLKKTSTLKDLNFLRKKKEAYQKKNIINFDKKDIKLINEQIKKDIQLFEKFNLMDYSLLLAIEKV